MESSMGKRFTIHFEYKMYLEGLTWLVCSGGRYRVSSSSSSFSETLHGKKVERRMRKLLLHELPYTRRCSRKPPSIIWNEQIFLRTTETVTISHEKCLLRDDGRRFFSSSFTIYHIYMLYVYQYNTDTSESIVTSRYDMVTECRIFKFVFSIPPLSVLPKTFAGMFAHL